MPISVTDLKAILDALEKLKQIRKELKAKLNDNALKAEDEQKFAEELVKVTKQINVLEDRKYEDLAMPKITK